MTLWREEPEQANFKDLLQLFVTKILLENEELFSQGATSFKKKRQEPQLLQPTNTVGLNGQKRNKGEERLKKKQIEVFVLN